MQQDKDIIPDDRNNSRADFPASFNLKKGIICTISCIGSSVAFLSVIVGVMIAGCATSEKVVERRYYWPPLPDTPRIEWLGSFTSQLDFPKTKGQAMMESLVGIEAKTFDKPWGIASNGNGLVYITDAHGAGVNVYDFNNKTVETLTDEESGELFKSPVGVALDMTGNIYVTDSNKHRIYVFSPDKKPFLSIGEDGSLDGPTGITIDDERKRLYVINSRKDTIKAYDLSGNFLFEFSGSGDRPGYLNHASDLDIDSKGNIVVGDTINARIQIFSPEGKFIKAFGQRGDSPGDFNLIKGVAVDKKTDNVYVVDGRGDKVLIFSKEGEALLVFGRSANVRGITGPGGFALPQDINIDWKGQIFVVDSLNRRFQIFKIIDEEWLKEHPVE